MKNFLLKPPYFFYEHFIKRQKEGASFVIFFYFLIAFILARLYVYLGILGILPESLTQNIKGVHVHHFAYGIVISSLVGYLSLVLPRHHFRNWKMKLSAFFGIGLGLTFDEFGMWLRLEDDYVFRRGYDAIIIISILFLNIIYFANLWQKLAQKIYQDLFSLCKTRSCRS